MQGGTTGFRRGTRVGGAGSSAVEADVAQEPSGLCWREREPGVQARADPS
jgi:hypothetical protein